jgi:hypothetical protein
VLDDSFANSNQDMDISDITQPYNRFIAKGVDNTLSVSSETRPTPGQEALFKALGLWYVLFTGYLRILNHTQ